MRLRPLGAEAEAADEPGIAARSAAAAPSPGQELAYFGGQGLKPRERLAFTEWFWPGGTG